MSDVAVEKDAKKPGDGSVETQLNEPRRVNLTLARIDPWSILKVGFLLSVALGIATVVVVIILWYVLNGMGVFGSIEAFLQSLGASSFLKLMDYVRLPRVTSYATILGIVNVVLLTAVSTLAALVYNLLASMVGGVRVALMDE